jgi:hypothetical protein
MAVIGNYLVCRLWAAITTIRCFSCSVTGTVVMKVLEEVFEMNHAFV